MKSIFFLIFLIFNASIIYSAEPAIFKLNGNDVYLDTYFSPEELSSTDTIFSKIDSDLKLLIYSKPVSYSHITSKIDNVKYVGFLITKDDVDWLESRLMQLRVDAGSYLFGSEYCKDFFKTSYNSIREKFGLPQSNKFYDAKFIETLKKSLARIKPLVEKRICSEFVKAYEIMEIKKD